MSELPFYGHKDKALAGHTTACPGDQWPNYRPDIEEALMAGLTPEQALTLYRSQTAGLQEWTKKYWAAIWLYNIAQNGWPPLPPELA